MGCIASKEISVAEKARGGSGRYDEGGTDSGMDLSWDVYEGKSVKSPSTSSKKALLGRAGTYGLDKAVKVVDTVGSSMTNLCPNTGFSTGITSSGSRSNKVNILAFEVANTIVKAANLGNSLSEQNIHLLKNHVVHSEGIHQLVSTDTKYLLTLTASDKMEEFAVFSTEVIRFGNRCQDPQWHNLGRYFQKLDSDMTPKEKLREAAAVTMKELISLTQYTSELYHELDTYRKMEHDYEQKLKEEESIVVSRRRDTLMALHIELKQQGKIVKGLKRKSLWFKKMDEVVENLVEVAMFLHKQILEAFELKSTKFIDNARVIHNPNKLGVSGLALHYANVINQISRIASQPMPLLPNTRNTLYSGFPINVKMALRSRLLSFNIEEELTISLIKAKMEKTLGWISLMAENTIKAHQGFGWVGEWATKMGSKGDVDTIFSIQTLYHADKEKTEENIVQLAVWLHHLVYKMKNNVHRGGHPKDSNFSISKTRSNIVDDGM